MVIHSAFEVSLLSADLRPDESIIQIADTLDYVNQMTSDIFGRIRDRISECQTKIQEINSRTNLAQEKVQKLVGSKKAVTVFSSSTYPVQNLSAETAALVPVFTSSIKRSSVPTSRCEPQEKSKIFQVPFKKPEHTVASAPMHSVGGLLVFDTLESIHEVPSPEPEEEMGMTLADAPHSILEREGLERPTALSYLYSPHLGDVPQLDLPLDLPDLPGIATDIIYESDLGPGIAPSLGFNLNIHQAILEGLPELPDIQSIETSHQPPPPPPPVVIVSVAAIAPIPAAPAPPPPPPMLPVIHQAPPPPPPPISMPKLEIQKREEVVAPEADRSNLMDAIRKAGGTKALKKTKAEIAKVDKPTLSAAPAGDLMADLFSKLSMRRKGISGIVAGQTEAQNAVSAMDRVNALIPPPPKPAAPAATEDDEDWQ